MIFMLFAVAIAALFFVGSLIALRLGQHLGLRHRKRSGGEGIGGLATVEGAIFGLMGLLLAFTISGALQRFDDRRQLVIQEATAATTAYDRLKLFGGDEARSLQSSLKNTSAPGSISIEWRMICCWFSGRKTSRISKKRSCLNSRTSYGTRRWRLAHNRTTVLHAPCRSQH